MGIVDQAREVGLGLMNVHDSRRVQGGTTRAMD
jgi:hypothetical protein